VVVAADTGEAMRPTSNAAAARIVRDRFMSGHFLVVDGAHGDPRRARR
jgi:hypothetical protein